MTSSNLQKALDDVFDQGLIYHAVTVNMRDYEIIVYCTADPATGIEPAIAHCFSVIASKLMFGPLANPKIWRKSLDERVIDHATGVDHDGYVWGVKWQMLYPGGSIVADSDRAAEWSDAVAAPPPCRILDGISTTRS